ncbi:MAG: HaeIII family restriction endonuclease [Candidatus Pacebacteria bacterium]|nr:HaeIII family restriction endonuclease [Candidatus Paceibacterota bacterium]
MRNGKAYEYACVLAFKAKIFPIRNVVLIENTSMKIARTSWNTMDKIKKEELLISATAGIESLIKVEPRIVEDGNDLLELSLQADNEGQDGDVRDVLIIRKSIDWVIGLSVKHNHYAIKHSRLSTELDFGLKWLGIPCSDDYFSEIKPYFSKMKQLKKQGIMWKDVSNKAESFYVPILSSFIKELNSKYNKHGSVVVEAMAEYLLGKKDYYKLISNKSERSTRLISFNLHGTLNQPSKKINPEIMIPSVELPRRIFNLAMKPGSNNTIELNMDNGWEMSLRIHSASSKVESSLKFDVQFTGMPTSLFIIDSPWVD